MLREELATQKNNSFFSTESPLTRGFFSFGVQENALPQGSVITVTGETGVGKTRFALQLIKDILIFSPYMSASFYSYEMNPQNLCHLLDAIDKDNILNGNFNFYNDVEVKSFKNNIIIIDSLDFWANQFFNSDYPNTEMARKILNWKNKGATIIQIHHYVKSKKITSGSSIFDKLNDVKIELIRKNDDTVICTTRKKNRYMFNKDYKELKHTKNGLVVHEPRSFYEHATTFWKRITK